jgi:hypothetical protein
MNFSGFAKSDELRKRIGFTLGALLISLPIVVGTALDIKAQVEALLRA